jgi:hypothetical protein
MTSAHRASGAHDIQSASTKGLQSSTRVCFADGQPSVTPMPRADEVLLQNAPRPRDV